jgi:hypothetical protein
MIYIMVEVHGALRMYDRNIWSSLRKLHIRSNIGDEI